MTIINTMTIYKLYDNYMTIITCASNNYKNVLSIMELNTILNFQECKSK